MKNTSFKKVQIDFQQVEFEKAVQQLNNAAAIYNKALDCFQAITGERKIQQIEELESYIKSKTGFSNIKMSATLLDLNAEYTFLSEWLSKLQPEVIEIKNGIAVVKPTLLDACKETYTIYLKDTLVEDYHLLEQACAILNKVSNPTYTKFMRPDYNGKYSVAKIQLNNSVR